MTYPLGNIDRKRDFESKKVLKKVTLARSALAELKGVANTLPNKEILINTLSLQEAKDSSAIENIITTHDELFRSDLTSQRFASISAKEVYNYADALREGYESMRQIGLLRTTDILSIQSRVEQNRAGFRSLPGTVLKNEQTEEVVYMPPQHPDDIVSLMDDLVDFINSPHPLDLDPLISVALIHHQFESIHPFYDGNGRTGRIINILYLVKEGLLDTPILYMSRYINQHKSEYYRLLQTVRTEDRWEEWILYFLDGIEQTARETIVIIAQIKDLMLQEKQQIRSMTPKIYSQDLLNNIFKHPYTKIEFLINDLGKGRITTTKYLDQLCEIGILDKMKLGKENLYIHTALFDLLKNV